MPPVETIELRSGQKVYFASDFHLGTPTPEKSRERERAIVDWLETARADAAAIFLVGDVFDFWFEYKQSIPKGFARLQGKLAELTDAGLPITLFTGNHDMWMSDYFTSEMGIPVYRKPRVYDIGGKRFYIGHGDGLGPGDHVYKQLKKVFENGLARWLFRWVHPDIGISLALAWSRKSRASGAEKGEEVFLGENREWLYLYCQEVEKRQHHDYYIFGHRHLPLDLSVTPNSRYVNIGEWLHARTYGVFDGQTMALKEWK
ncbi:UDP-2,3-diacylglucosamine diphosphatase [Rudanella paleaurantiibacter]|uniref:UDP-2,3-diacylglucosamine diphosphatase n=1 Tax=Rudanella paleaurantiibacter TaxID=2614655 RepID=A0A7J5TUA4_9BACT|nr:UDP-2,3-diacylglucosamine diphosphatase [Rudanella paleaurantiibacter]KAB7727561.1 UDP-2,3-diacylglucosamine diphosphatase [Rudanella paleaurantiibacter]